MTFALTLLIAATAAVSTPAADFYVAPDGNDANAGTVSAPFATVQRAQAAVRQEIVRAGGDLKRDLVVLIRAGEYYMEEPLILDGRDGTASGSVTYAAEPKAHVVLSGGRVIEGWRDAGNGRWTATIAEVKAGKWFFRDLYANGQRLTRSRFPNAPKLLRIASVSDDVTQMALSEAPPAGISEGARAELVIYQNWSITRGVITGLEDRVVTTANPMGWIGHGSYTTASPDKPCILEHALEFIDAPGEWYLDAATGTLTYMAEPNEDPRKKTFIAPYLEHLVRADGTAQAPVRNVRFLGIQFQHAAWTLPDFGYCGIQAGHHGTTTQERPHILPNAIEFLYSENCSVKNCVVAHTGASAIGFGPGCRENDVTGCAIEDVGGNGVVVGWRGRDMEFAESDDLAADWLHRADAPAGNSVTDCTVRACGAVNHGCVGIFDAFCKGTHIAHNHVTDMPYTGISIGYRWDTSATSQEGCTVEFNHVYDVMKMLADGGCIYTLGLQPGTVLRGNHLHQVHRSEFAHGGAPNNGIFFDQGSKGYLVEQNVIYDTSGEPIRFNQTDEGNMTWVNNHFGVAPEDPAFPKAVAANAGPRKK